METFFCRPAEAKRQWILIDAEGQTLGRLSTFVARALMGKHRPTYTPSVDTGDFVVVVNADKVLMTGKKEENKFYRWHTGYPGGIKQIAAGRMLKAHPERVIEWAVKGMLPKGSLGRRMGMKLKAYKGPEHPHQAQQPVQVEIPVRGAKKARKAS